MTTKNLISMGVIAVLLGGAAYIVHQQGAVKGAQLNGKAILPDLNLAEVASVQFGDKLKLVAGTNGWQVETYHGYPADQSKLTGNLLKLTELKVGQVVRGKDLEGANDLVLRNAKGEKLAALTIGEKHAKWGRGRYVRYQGETVLVADTLDGFDGAGEEFVEKKIVDTPYIVFNDIVEGLSEEELGFATGVVAKVTIAGDTNRTVTVGSKVKDGTERYLKLDNDKWIFKVPAYSVENIGK